MDRDMRDTAFPLLLPRHGDFDGTLVHALQSVVLEVSEVSKVSEDLPCGRRKPTPLSVGPPPNADELRYFSLHQPTPAKPLNLRLF
jgi:hypothetical protein